MKFLKSALLAACLLFYILRHPIFAQDAQATCPQYEPIINLMLRDPSITLTQLRQPPEKPRPWFKRLSRLVLKEQWSELNRLKLEAFFARECQRHNLVDDLHRGTLTGLQLLKELVEVPASAVVGLLQGIFSRRDLVHLENQKSFFYQSEEFFASSLINSQLATLASIPWWQYQLANQLWQSRMQRWCREFRLSNQKSFISQSCDEFKKIDLWSTQLSEKIKNWVIKQKHHLWGKREDQMPKQFWWIDVQREEDFCTLAIEQQKQLTQQNTPGWKRKLISMRIDRLAYQLTHPDQNYLPVSFSYHPPLADQQVFLPLPIKIANLLMGIDFHHHGLKEDTVKIFIQQKIKELADLQKKLYKIMQTKTLKNCLTIKSSLSFEIKQMQKVQQELLLYEFEAAQIYRNQQFKDYLVPQIDRAVEKSNLEWHYLPVNHVSALMAALRSNQVDHLFLIMHADEEGRLHDGLGNIIPKEIFSLIGSRLKSILILSCYIDKVLAHYQLPKYLATMPSHEGWRQLTIIKEKKFDSSEKKWTLTSVEKLSAQVFSSSFKYFEALLTSFTRETKFLTPADNRALDPAKSSKPVPDSAPQCRLILPSALVKSIEGESSTLMISSEEKQLNLRNPKYLVVIDSKERPHFSQKVNDLSILRTSLIDLIALFSKPLNLNDPHHLNSLNYEYAIPCPSVKTESTENMTTKKINLLFENIRFAPPSDRRNIRTSEGAEVFGLPGFWKNDDLINEIKVIVSQQGEEKHFVSSSQRTKAAIFKNEGDTIRRALSYRLELLPLVLDN